MRREMIRKMLLLPFLLGLILLAGLGIRGEGDAEPQRWTVSMELEDYRNLAAEERISWDRIMIHHHRILLSLSRGQLDILRERGVPFLEWGIPPFVSTGRKSSVQGGMNGRYHDYRETAEKLEMLSRENPRWARMSAFGRSVEGRELQVLKISDFPEMEEDEPRIYIIGCHHAREWISVEIPLLWAEYLLQDGRDSEAIQRILREAQVYVIPLLNPDGLEYSIHVYRMWRKNRRYLGDLQWGVDLNRNYGYRWGYDEVGSSSRPGSDSYRGEAPFSEPEVACLGEFMKAHPPGGSLSFHNYSQYILFPWGYTREPAPDSESFRILAAAMSDRIYRVNGRRYEYGSGARTIYPTNGDSDDWIYGTFGCPAFTIELPPAADGYANGHFFTPEEEIQRTFSEMLPAIIYFCTQIIDTHLVNTAAIPLPERPGMSRRK